MKKVITYGTFDLFHQGHYRILERAKAYGDYLIVGVTGENYDEERGKLSVKDSLSKRIENVRKTGFADLIIVEEYLGQKISDIIKYDVDVLIVGSDWKGKFDHLRQYCDVVYLERTKDISSTKLREEKFDIYRLGIMTNDLNDNNAIIEAKSVSGIHVESVYAIKEEVAQNFARTYELCNGYNDFEDFLQNVDIIYCKDVFEDCSLLLEKAIRKGKHLIYDAPLNLNDSELNILIDLAKENNVYLLFNVSMIYLQSFSKLLWLIKSKEIGDIISIKCSLSKSSFQGTLDKKLSEMAFYSIAIITKLMGKEKYVHGCCHKVQTNTDDSYCVIDLSYKNSVALIEIGIDVELEDELVIFGTKGTISIPDTWWNLGYFKLKKKNSTQYERYSYNFEGNGFRYIIRSLLQMIRKETTSIQRITRSELYEILSVIQILESNKLTMEELND